MKSIAIEWEKSGILGNIEVYRGIVGRCVIVKGQGWVEDSRFSFEPRTCSCRLNIEVQNENEVDGSSPTIVTINADRNPFSFLLQDISKEYPVIMTQYGVVVTEVEDERSYMGILKTVMDSGRMTSLQKMQCEPEETFEAAASNTRNFRCQTWLGIGRDIRIFALGFRDDKDEFYDWIQPRQHGYELKLPENEDKPVRYRYLLGRGMGCSRSVTRYLEDGVLPILHATIVDEDITYNVRTFVSLECETLNKDRVQGTHYLVADGYGLGSMFTDEQTKKRQELMESIEPSKEETVIYFRADAINTSDVPKYAWFKTIIPNASFAPTVLKNTIQWNYNPKTGFGEYSSDRVFCISHFNDGPMTKPDMAVLLKPGETARFEFILPHSPISEERGYNLVKMNFDQHYLKCRDYWLDKLDAAAKVSVPEKRITDMLMAGLLHIDLILYGQEPTGTLTPMIGEYCPIGTESAPIIQFLDSMGLHDLARRSLNYFLEKQHEDGFIQNFSGYMVETGAALWCIGEHYRYTRDEKWIFSIKDKLLKSCNYLLEWRKKNLRDELQGKGYGMLDGKAGDPEEEEPIRMFMLNAYAYAGLIRTAEMLASIDPSNSKYLGEMAKSFGNDIKNAFLEALKNGVTVPLENGNWVPTSSPWPGRKGPLCLYVDGGECITHASINLKDALLGPLYLVFHDILDYDGLYADILLEYHIELFCLRNVCFSQPYYSVHPWIHLKRGESGAFLKSYYNAFAAMADRETFTFREHSFENSSQHKTHEEAWFLMQTRWMLYMEDGNTLNILPGIPRNWLEDGKSISISGMKSYFGSLELLVKSEIATGKVKASVIIDAPASRLPSKLKVRVPHPYQLKAFSTSIGEYDSFSETVTIKEFVGSAQFEVCFNKMDYNK